MSTRAELRERVRAYLDEPVAAYWTDAQLNSWINQSYFYYYQWIVMTFDGYFSKDIVFDIVAAQAKYAVPADFFKIRLLERVFESCTVPMRAYDRMETPNITSGSNYANYFLPTYRFEGQNIVLEPTPNITVTNGIRLEYIPAPTSLTTDLSTPDAGFMAQWEECVVLRAALSAKLKEEAVVNSGTDATSLASMLASWEQTIKDSMEQRTTNRRYSEPFGSEDTDTIF